MIQREFNEVGDFRAYDACRHWLESLGFSVGSMQRDAPTAAMFGNYAVAKWRNLSDDERRETHARITSEAGFRSGPVKVTLMACAPDEAIAAFVKSGPYQFEAPENTDGR